MNVYVPMHIIHSYNTGTININSARPLDHIKYSKCGVEFGTVTQINGRHEIRKYKTTFITTGRAEQSGVAHHRQAGIVS